MPPLSAPFLSLPPTIRTACLTNTTITGTTTSSQRVQSSRAQVWPSILGPLWHPPSPRRRIPQVIYLIKMIAISVLAQSEYQHPTKFNLFLFLVCTCLNESGRTFNRAKTCSGTIVNLQDRTINLYIRHDHTSHFQTSPASDTNGVVWLAQ
jgi:hypothetical protein